MNNDKSLIDQNFVSVSVYNALYETEQGEQEIVLELRVKSDRSKQLFTIIDSQHIYSDSIQALLLARPNCKLISISHSIVLVWNEEKKNATLVEAFCKDKHTSKLCVILKMTCEGLTYETSECDTLSDAISELHELTGQSITWHLQTCYDCRLSDLAFLGPTDERDELRCYRDAPEALQEEVETKYKFASLEALNSGVYFVSAFHRCAAWKPMRPWLKYRPSENKPE